MEICQYNDCIGCYCCMNVCRHNAISMVSDDLGIVVPKIDHEKCVNCGLCVKTCPMNNQPQYNKPQNCYAVWVNNAHDRRSCASGGVATGLSRYILRKGGVVYGAAFNEALQLTHTKVITEAQLEKLKGSKYVQSYIGFTYRSVQGDLEIGRFVLFIGTPCQIDGLKHYLGRAYHNLLTVDLVCHGTPPQQYLDEYIEGIVNEHIDKVTFRGEKDFKFTLYRKNKVVYQKNNDQDLYMRAFMASLIYRNSCYNCRYAQKDRVSDMTIGDYWGLDKNSLKEHYQGKISVVLINTSQGNAYFAETKDLFSAEERNIAEALQGNTQLNNPTQKHKDRTLFETVYKQKGFTKALQATSIRVSVIKARAHFVVTLPIKVLRKIFLFN